MLCYAWGYVDAYQAASLEAEPWTGIPDLFAHTLSRLISILIRRGLHRAYRVESNAVRGIRGTIDLSGTVQQALQIRQQLQCRFDELSHDTAANRIIKSVLKLMLRAEAVSPELQKRIEGLYRRLAHISDVPLHGPLFRKIQIHRNNRLYRFVLDVCRLIYESQVSSETAGFVQFADFRKDEHKMRLIFEEFVRNFYDHHAVEYNVGRTHMTWADACGSKIDLRLLPQMKTDIVLRSNNRYLIIDTKFTGKIFEEQFGAEKLRTTHLYQIFAYVKNAAFYCSEGVNCEAMLLYPVVGTCASADYEISGSKLYIRSIDLNQEWAQIHDDLLAIIR